MKGKTVVFLLAIVTPHCWGFVGWFPSDGCELESDPGLCLLNVDRFFYNKTSNECELFIYTGCGGNENNFISKRRCEQTCVNSPEKDPEGATKSYNEEGDFISGRNLRNSRKMFKPLFRTRLFPAQNLLFRAPPFFTSFFNTRNPFGMPRLNFRPFANPFRRRPFNQQLMNTFGSPTGRMSFQTIISKTRQSLGKEIEKTFEMVSKTFKGNGTHVNIVNDGKDLKCAICKRVVGVIEYEMKVIKLSIDSILKLVDFICSFFPLSKAKCDKIIADITNITKFIDQGLSPKEVCINLEMCSNATLPEGVTKSVAISFSKTCSPLCNFMKSIQGESLSKMTQSWNNTQYKLRDFCRKNGILAKCDKLYEMIDKSFNLVANVTKVSANPGCECFKQQPVFETEKFDSCLQCRQFEKGMFKELMEINKTIFLLSSRIKDLCPLFKGKKCYQIVTELRNSIKENNLSVMPNLCKVTGYCDNKEKNYMIEQVKETFGKLKGIFGEPTDMLSDVFGGELNLRKFSPDCVFCKKCMRDLKQTFQSITNGTNASSSNTYPAVKEGFGLYCETKSVGDEYKTVCKKISDGIETVHENITKRGDGETICKTLNLC